MFLLTVGQWCIFSRELWWETCESSQFVRMAQAIHTINEEDPYLWTGLVNQLGWVTWRGILTSWHTLSSRNYRYFTGMAAFTSLLFTHLSLLAKYVVLQPEPAAERQTGNVQLFRKKNGKSLFSFTKWTKLAGFWSVPNTGLTAELWCHLPWTIIAMLLANRYRHFKSLY